MRYHSRAGRPSFESALSCAWPPAEHAGTVVGRPTTQQGDRSASEQASMQASTAKGANLASLDNSNVLIFFCFLALSGPLLSKANDLVSQLRSAGRQSSRCPKSNRLTCHVRTSSPPVHTLSRAFTELARVKRSVRQFSAACKW